ncbi:CoA transferase [Mycolicibacterium sp.]|uniref:CoA transferase n=1 Tax=Mycolicibacterium sp. TaxID=2320850 RepID=UPI003D0F1B33
MSALAVPAAVLSRAQRTATEVGARAGIDIDAAELIGGRATLLGLPRPTRISAGGATRLLAARDGWCALTLSRTDDIDAVPALVSAEHVGADPWAAVQRWAAEVPAAVFAERARLLGLPVGVLGETRPIPVRVRRTGPGVVPAPWSEMLVADLSSMWAGPLCGRLLARAGATVVKVESRARPDGTRAGPAPFFDWVNGGKLSYQADFAKPQGLRRLLAAADVVIESSRPAALGRRGLGPDDIVGRPGRIWLRVTGHGTDGPRADWVAFGDDAAASGGLVGGSAGAPVFCGDAIADPLTGLHAAEAVLDSRARGGGEVLEIAMAAVAAGYASLPVGNEIACTTVLSPGARAAELGADTAAVDRLVGARLVGSC